MDSSTKKMYRLIVLGLALSALGSLSGCTHEPVLENPSDQICCGGEAQSPSSQKIGVLSKNFGTILQGEPLVETFDIPNDLSKPIQLTGSPDVSYPEFVKVEVPKGPFKPGSSIPVKVTVDTSKEPGPLDIFVQLKFDSPGPISTLHLSGEIASR